MKKKKNGFILMETIVVISVLCVILVMLYGAYSNILIKVSERSLYDNAEYIYKTVIVRDYLEDIYIPEGYYTVICSNLIPNNDRCYTDNVDGDERATLFQFLEVEAVYLTYWDTTSINAKEFTNFEATTQNYIKSLDPPKSSISYRIIVMFKQENNETDQKKYEYATLGFGSRE